MKKNSITLLSFLISGLAFSQIGVNTPDPKATFDITAKNPTGISTSPEGVLLPRIDRQRAGAMTGIETSTLIYVDNISTGAQTGRAANIDTVGYYYFNGTVWVKLNDGVNIYNQNGTLTESRTVTQGTNRLTFSGSAVNAFSVDGNTFSVDAENNRVGLGTSAPSSVLSVINPTPGNTVDAFSAGINNCGAPCGQGTARNISIFNKNGTNAQFGSIDFIPSIADTGVTGASIQGIDRNAANNYAGLQFNTRNAQNFNARMVIRSAGNIGIGTTSPNAGALVDISSTTQGFLPPRMTTAQRDAIASKPEGLTVYNTDLHCMQYWNATTWKGDCSEGGEPEPGTGTIVNLNCSGATHNGTLTIGNSATGVNSQISYTGGNGGAHSGQTVTSTGVSGLTATLSAGNFANGAGILTYTITGIPSGSGTANFAINIGGQSCSISRNVESGAGAVTALNCGSATHTGSLANGVAALPGVTASIPYTGGNGGAHSGQVVTSTGVTGLTATLDASNFNIGNGNLVYNITGIASNFGIAHFAVNIGGQVCELNVTVNDIGYFKCTDIGKYASPYAKEDYYVCATSGGTLKGYRFTCQTPTIWNQATETCVYP